MHVYLQIEQDDKLINTHQWPDHYKQLPVGSIMSREAKKNQQPLSQLFTRSTAKKLANALAKLP